MTTAFIRIKNILKTPGAFYQSYKNKYIAFIFRMDDIPSELTLVKINDILLSNITSLNVSYVTADSNLGSTFPALTSDFWSNVETLIPIVNSNKYLAKFTYETNIYYIVLGKIDSFGNPLSVGCGNDILLEINFDELTISEVDFQKLKLESQPENLNCSIVSQIVGIGQTTITL